MRTWVLQESEFQTVSAETVHGVTGITMDNQPVQKYTYRGHRTFFGNQIDSSGSEQIQCKVCGAQHDVCNCEEILQMSVKERWNIAKQFQLCFRCLEEGHSRKAFQEVASVDKIASRNRINGFCIKPETDRLAKSTPLDITR